MFFLYLRISFKMDIFNLSFENFIGVYNIFYYIPLSLTFQLLLTSKKSLSQKLILLFFSTY